MDLVQQQAQSIKDSNPELSMDECLRIAVDCLIDMADEERDDERFERGEDD